MADEFNALLTEFSVVGPAFCANLRQVVADTELRKVVAIYEAGLKAAMTGTAEVLRTHVEALPASQREEINRLIGASGARELMAATNAALTGDHLGSLSSLASIPGIIEIVKKIIENFVSLPGGPGELLHKVDLILDGLGKLFGFPKTAPGSEGTGITDAQTARRQQIRGWIDEILRFGSDDPKLVNAANALRDILRKGEITDDDFARAKRIRDETLGP